MADRHRSAVARRPLADTMHAYRTLTLWDSPIDPPAPTGPLEPADRVRSSQATRTSPLRTPEGFALNPEQMVAATFEGGHCLVLAGAGTGKTRTIIARAATLIASGVPAERLLILAFTRRAAREIADRLRGVGGIASDGVVAGTFHHFCLLTMRRRPVAWDIAGMNVLDRDDVGELWRLVRADEVEKGEVAFPKADRIAEWYSYARNCDLPFETYTERFVGERDAEVRARLVRIATAYEARKHLRRYLDFDDILVRFADGLTADAALRDSVAGHHDEILVDEFQDTNPIQWRILDALAARGPADGGDAGPTGVWQGPRLYCVGDDAQSIYAFRGADFQTIHSFERRLPGSSVLALSRNYRSHQAILDVANGLLERSPLAYRRRLVADRAAKGDVPVLLTFGSPWAEGAWIARDLVRRASEHGASWRDHIILLRTGRSGRDIEAALIAARVPYVLIGGTSLLQAAHVRDVLALLRASLSPRDELAWSRHLRLWRGVGEVAARRVVEAMETSLDMAEAIERGERVLGRREPFVPVIAVRRLREDAAAALTTAVRALEPMLSGRYDDWPRRKGDLDLLVRLAERHRTIEGFLDTYTLDPVVAERIEAQDDADRVRLITVHSAKGTEADVAYVAAASGRHYPHVRSRGDADAIEEERRILYVALTRARDELIITRSVDVDHGWVFDASPMAFVDDLPDGTVWRQVGDDRAVRDA